MAPTYLSQDSGCVICRKQFGDSSTLRNRCALEKICYIAIEFYVVSRRELATHDVVEHLTSNFSFVIQLYAKPGYGRNGYSSFSSTIEAAGKMTAHEWRQPVLT
jgi:hypothetical protein